MPSEIEDDVRADIEAAMEEIETGTEVTEPVVEETVEEVDTVETVETEVVSQEPAIEPPVSYTATVKEKWKDLPVEVQKELVKREGDIHKMMTSPDGDLRIGRDMKEVLTPYTPLFNHIGVTPKDFMSDVLHKTHILNSGTPEQKVGLLRQLAAQHGVDLNAQVDPSEQRYSQIESRLQQIAQMANPAVIKNQLQEEMMRDTITSNIEAFKADPKNVYFDQVKPVMGSLLKSGQAKDMQDAYDQACWASPQIRAELLKAQTESQKANQKKEVEAKKRASASVTGSPGLTSPQTRAPQTSLEDDIRQSWDALTGTSI